MLSTKGPLLIASNHPNSFLDAVIYDILFAVPIWSLARGDVFKRFPKAIPFLSRLKIFPVFRTREGSGHLTENYQTFNACMKVFENNEAVTIFSEALCVNEWHLRPLKKGTARIAFMAWEKGLPVKVLPAGINYSSFRRFGKKIDVNFGQPIEAAYFNLNDTDGNKYIAFNNQLTAQLKQLVYEIEKGDNQTFNSKFDIQPGILRKILFFFPALLAVMLHWPLYIAAKFFTRKLVNDNDHYDSVMFAFLLFVYPMYLLLAAALLWFFSHTAWGLLLLFLMPLSVWCLAKINVRKDAAFTSSSF